MGKHVLPEIPLKQTSETSVEDPISPFDNLSVNSQHVFVQPLV